MFRMRNIKSNSMLALAVTVCVVLAAGINLAIAVNAGNAISASVWAEDSAKNYRNQFNVGEAMYIYWMEAPRGSTVDINVTDNVGTVLASWTNQPESANGTLTYTFSETGYYFINCGGVQPFPIAVATIFVAPTRARITFASSGLSGDATGNLVSFSVIGGSYSGATSPIGVAGGYIDVDIGATVTYTFVDPVTSSVTGKRYRLSSVTGPSSGFTVSSSATLTGNYVTQYDLKFDQAGLDSTAQGTIVSVTIGANPAVNLVFGDFVKDFGYVDVGTTMTYTFTSAVASSMAGKQFVLTAPAPTPASGFLLSGPTTVTGTYKTRYLLTVKTNGLPSPYTTTVKVGGSPTTDDLGVSTINDASTDGWRKWFDASPPDTATIGVDFPVAGGVGTQYVFKDWSDLSTSNPHAGLTLAGPVTLTANYRTQYEITVTASPPGAIGGSFKVTYTLDGTTLNAESHTTSWSTWADAGTPVTVSNPQYTIPPNYKFDHYSPSNTVTMHAQKTITLFYITLPYSAVTTSSLCPFDTDKNPATGQQFNLLFTRDPTDVGKYKLAASNPGQFYYNAFYIGAPTATVAIDLIIPPPFVTQGAVPIHVYSDVTVSSTGCFTPGTEILSVAKVPGTGGTISFSVTVPDTGLVYVTIHLDFGWKKQTGYTVGSSSKPPLYADNTDDVHDIPNLSPYLFKYNVGVSEQPGSPTIKNINIFKSDPGFYGVVTVNKEPTAGAKITIRDSTDKIVGTATTDDDGYYFFYYKYIGKEAEFTVTMTSAATGTKSQAVTLKSNKFVWAPFEL